MMSIHLSSSFSEVVLGFIQSFISVPWYHMTLLFIHLLLEFLILYTTVGQECWRLNQDILTISKWDGAKRVDFNARKPQCCMLTHRDIESTMSSVHMNGIDFEEKITLDILGT